MSTQDEFMITSSFRYYLEDCGLPEELRPRFMEKTHGLRTRVIRSLFYLYTPLVARVTAMSPFGDEPDTLLGSRCALIWYVSVMSWKLTILI